MLKIAPIVKNKAPLYPVIICLALIISTTAEDLETLIRATEETDESRVSSPVMETQTDIELCRLIYINIFNYLCAL